MEALVSEALQKLTDNKRRIDGCCKLRNSVNLFEK